jgi:tetratricopeptide (TPR) repeat protein
MRMSHRALLVSALALGLGLAAPVGVGLAANSGGGSSGGSSSSGGGSSSTTTTSTTSEATLYKQASAMVDAKDYRGAMAILDKIIAKNPRNADALNLMGFCSRKTGEGDEAEEYYGKALAINPNHLGANEYLGEYYLEEKNLTKAEERLKILTKACHGCTEQKELEAAIAKFKASNS